MNRDEIHLDLLRRIEKNPQYTQRALSKDMGISLGKVNYCVKKIIEKGWVKASNFSKNPNKLNYTYLLTPSGIESKAKLTISFLHKKIEEYEELKSEISQLKEDSEKL